MKKKTSNVKGAPAVAVQRVVRPRPTHHTYFEEFQLTRTSKNIKDEKILALEINRLIHGALSQDAKFVDLQWDAKNKWFTLFARRTRQVA
jgi:hypothetical protein